MSTTQTWFWYSAKMAQANGECFGRCPCPILEVWVGDEWRQCTVQADKPTHGCGWDDMTLVAKLKKPYRIRIYGVVNYYHKEAPDA